MSKSVTKADLVNQIAAETGMKKVDAEKAIAALTTAIQKALVGGGKVTLVGFGTFEVKTRASRTGRNPQTKAKMEIPSSKTIRFKPGRAFIDSVN
jgi:DNA-binding protein HU-beta